MPGRASRCLRALTVGLTLFSGGVLVASCSSSPSACGSGSNGHIVLDNGQHPATTDRLVCAFERATGIAVSVRSNDEDILADEIAAEGRHATADVVYTENSPALQYLAGKGLLAPLPRSILSAVPRRDEGPSSNWVGVSARVSVLVYNTRLLRQSQLPRSVLALASPRWRNKLAIAPEETDFQPIVTAVTRAYGTAAALRWLRGVRANGASHEYADNETITAEVNSGQAAIGIINQYYWYRLRAELGTKAMHSAIAFFAPRNPGYVLDVSGAAVLAASHDKKAAERFLSFVVSRRGQEIIARSDSFEYPLRPGVAPAPGLVSLSSLRPYPITISELGDGSQAIRLMSEAGLLP